MPAKTGTRPAPKQPAGKRSAATRKTAAGDRKPRRETRRSAPPRTRVQPARSRRRAGAPGGANVPARNLTARSAAVRAQRRERRRSVIIVLVAITVASTAGLALIRSPLLDIDRVEVTGVSDVGVADVVAAAAIPMGSPILDLEVEAVAARVEQIPEVRAATVGRQLDGTVTIVVTEREPTMALKTADGYVLVDDDGRQVRVTAEPPDGFLPVIGLQATGRPGDPAPPGSTSVLRLMAQITPPVRAAVSEVIVTGDELALGLIDGGRAVLGQDEELEAKVISLETLLLSVDLRCVHEIDLTVPSAPAVSRIGENGNPRDGLADLTKCS